MVWRVQLILYEKKIIYKFTKLLFINDKNEIKKLEETILIINSDAYQYIN